mgnify:CR=1 FL=1
MESFTGLFKFHFCAADCLQNSFDRAAVCYRKRTHAAGPLAKRSEHGPVPRISQPASPAHPESEPQQNRFDPQQRLRGTRHARNTHTVRE